MKTKYFVLFYVTPTNQNKPNMFFTQSTDSMTPGFIPLCVNKGDISDLYPILTVIIYGHHFSNLHCNAYY